MSFNQKMLAGISVIVLAITLAIVFVIFDPPYAMNFKVEVAFVILAEIIACATLIAKIGKGNAGFHFAVSSLSICAMYTVFTLCMGLFTDCSTKVFVLWHGVGLAISIVLGMVLRMGEHHIAEQSKSDPPAQEIKRADVTWR